MLFSVLSLPDGRHGEEKSLLQSSIIWGETCFAMLSGNSHSGRQPRKPRHGKLTPALFAIQIGHLAHIGDKGSLN